MATRKRIVTKIGDVFCAVIEGRYKMYFQYICSDRSALNSSMIRVFKTKYDLQDTPSLEEVVKDEVMFYAHTVLRAGIENGSWEKVGKVPFDEPVRILFKTDNVYVDFAPFNWRIWYCNEPAMEIVGPIPAEYRHAEWGEVFPPFYITDRMRDGRYKGAIYDPGPLYN